MGGPTALAPCWETACSPRFKPLPFSSSVINWLKNESSEQTSCTQATQLCMALRVGCRAFPKSIQTLKNFLHSIIKCNQTVNRITGLKNNNSDFNQSVKPQLHRSLSFWGLWPIWFVGARSNNIWRRGWSWGGHRIHEHVVVATYHCNAATPHTEAYSALLRILPQMEPSFTKHHAVLKRTWN